MRRLIRLPLALVVLVALAGACSSDEDPTADGGSTTTTRRGPVDLEALLLAPADLDDGWAVDPEPGGDDSGEAECMKPTEDKAVDEAEVRLDFGAGDVAGVPSVSEALLLYDDTADLLADFDESEASVDGCGEFELPGNDGNPIHVEVSKEAAFATIGTRSAVWRFDLESQGTGFTQYLLFAYEGDIVVTLAYTDLGAGSIDDFEEIARTAFEKATAG